MGKVIYELTDYERGRRAILKQMKLFPESASDLEQALEALDKLNIIALSNPVTGYPNTLQRDIDVAEIQKSRREIHPSTHLYVAMLDIDNFGKFNKTYGEDVGNRVLEITTELLERSIRDYDTLDERLDHKDEEGPIAKGYHLHGEEKQIIFDAPDDETALRIVERYRKLVQEKSVGEGSPEAITESIGVTRFEYNDESFEDAQKRTDANMQLAKRNGKNQICLKNRDSMEPTYFPPQS